MDEARKFDLYDKFSTVNSVDPSHYARFDVKRGLRNADGTGVVAGITNISNVHGYVVSDGEKRADEGSLRYRGYEVSDLLGEDSADCRFGYEEIVYLLLLGELPTRDQLDRFIASIDVERELPET